jgi:hypothetical protein
MASITKQYQNYNELSFIGESMMFSGFVLAVMFTAIAGATGQFQPEFFDKIGCSIAYGVTGGGFIGGLIISVVAYCKKQAPLEIENPIKREL